jgi:hypothetical protein
MNSKLKNNIINFFKFNKYIIIFFLISTFVFLYQHFVSLSWDFSSYVLNAKYLFYQGNYFETLRAPLTPIILALFLIFGRLGEFLYIIFVSILFFYSSLKLSDLISERCFKSFDKYLLRIIFYFFSLNLFVLRFGLVNGTELLSLALFELFLFNLIQGKVSGHYLALAFLTRYSFLIYAPLLLFNKNYKKILTNIGLFLIITFPWFLFNYLKFGNWFTSIIDAYANNIYLRGYLYTSLNFKEIFTLINWYLPFFILGVIFAIYYLYKNKKNWFKKNILHILFIFIFILTIWDYSKIPLKQIRYLFNLVLPIAYFSSIGLFVIIKRKNRKFKRIIVWILFIILILMSLFFIGEINKKINHDAKFFESAQDIKDLGIEDCAIDSHLWVLINYFTNNVYPMESIQSSVYNNKIVLIFYDEHTIDDSFNQSNLDMYNKLHETDKYVFLTKKDFKIEDCSKKYTYDPIYVHNHCEIISEKFKKINLNNITLKICNKINKPTETKTQ